MTIHAKSSPWQAFECSGLEMCQTGLPEQAACHIKSLGATDSIYSPPQHPTPAQRVTVLWHASKGAVDPRNSRNACCQTQGGL